MLAHVICGIENDHNFEKNEDRAITTQDSIKQASSHRDHSYITSALVGGEGGQKIPISDYFQY